MLNAETLLTLAHAADAQAENMRRCALPVSMIGNVERAAHDARRVVEASNGFPTLETLTLRMVVDNDRAMAEALTDRARTIRERSTDLREALEAMDNDWRNALAVRVPSAEDHDQRARDIDALTTSYLADDLAEYVRHDLLERVDDAATRRIAEAPAVDQRAREAKRVTRAAADLVFALAAHAMANVDWHAVAREYRDRAERRGEWAGVAA